MARVKTPPVSSLINSGFVMPYPEIKKTTDKTSVSQTSTRLTFVKKRSFAFLICPVSLNLLSDFPDIKVFLNMRWKSVRYHQPSGTFTCLPCKELALNQDLFYGNIAVAVLTHFY